ncbi:MAG: PAS domain-containing protein [Deltaproteobacteria bacterium]|nr:PAS domain-containing protein [Deltaproteobacteria bacterium]MBW2417381.1 PAS domain-containing protein [Deltaproteobacteria bacterium]
MNGSDNQSLLSFIDSPIVVGDPDGRAIYANPAFEARFCQSRGSPRGEHLAALFAGGGREAMLAAVASVCTQGETVRFRLREDGVGYLAVASPIDAEGDRVGVVILLTDEPTMDGRFLDFYREIQEPLEEVVGCLDDLIDETGGRRDERFRSIVERSLGAMNRVRKWSEELHGLIRGENSVAARAESLAPVTVLRQVATRMAAELSRSGVDLELMLPAQLPVVRGDETLLETALVRLIRHRIAESSATTVLTLSARKAGDGSEESVLISLVDSGHRAADSGDAEPRMVRETVSILGGDIQTLEDDEAGRVTLIRLACV